MKHISFILLLSAASILTACTSNTGINLGQYPADPHASPTQFIYCHGYGCTQRSVVGIHDQDWGSVQRIFKKPAKTAKAERALIAKAIARIEYIIGETIGTSVDQPKAPIMRTSDKELDCIDETINTTKYLMFLAEQELTKFHMPDRPVHKGFFVNGVYPHNSASIKEIETGQIYVVDSYIFANGEEPVIRTLEDWRSYTTFESEER